MRKIVETLIIGAGAGGLGAGCWLKDLNRDFLIIDSSKSLPMNLHNGVHYLHSMPDLPFDYHLKEITLTDGILAAGKIEHKPNLIHSLAYSEKVREIQHPSSIMDVGNREKVYVPNTNNVNDLMFDCYNFISYENFYFNNYVIDIDIDKKIVKIKNANSGVINDIKYKYLISTIPLNVLREFESIKKLTSINIKLESSPINITNYKVEKIVPDWLINIYIPAETVPIYRASILNGICSVESMEETEFDIAAVLPMFHFKNDKPDKFCWKTGKVISISNDVRARIEEELELYGVYTIGRFGSWNRKLLIDSTIKQAEKTVEKIRRNWQ